MTKKYLIPLVIIFAFFTFASVSADVVNTVPEVSVVSSSSSYLIEDEDMLRVDVWGEQQLTNLQIQVTPGGNINVPYVGEVKASGITQEDLAKRISSKLQDSGIIYDAKVMVTILKVHDSLIHVLGQVARPGAVVIKKGDTVMDAISMAGSYTETAWLERATLVRKGLDAPIAINLRKMLLDGDLSQNIELQRGDTINVPAEEYNNKIYVLGHVLKPGLYPLKGDLTVLGAVSIAGGPNERGALRSTVVVRGNRNKPERVVCDLTKLFDKADLSQDILLQPGDVVLVPETRKPDWTKISQIINAIYSISSIRRYGLF